MQASGSFWRYHYPIFTAIKVRIRIIAAGKYKAFSQSPMGKSAAAVFCDIDMFNMGGAEWLPILIDDSRGSLRGLFRIPEGRDGCRKADECVASELLKLADHAMDRAGR